jgi:hypothetical protein
VTTINKKDIESFGKVLEVLGVAIQKNPSILSGLLQNVDQVSKEGNEEEVDVNKLTQIPLFQLAKNSPEKLEDTLKELTVPELKSLLKLNHLGGSNYKSRDSIIKFLLDQLKKRTTDVFREHSSEPTLDETNKTDFKNDKE